MKHINYSLLGAAFILFFIHSIALQAQWEQAPAPGQLVLSSLQKINGRLEATTSAGPFYSDDDGLLWHKRAGMPGSAIRTYGANYYTYAPLDVEFYKSSDGGASWQGIASNLAFLGQSISDFTVINDTIFATNTYKVWRNNPGSTDWTIVYENPQFGDLRLSNTNGYLWITKKQILRSSDQGNTWLDLTPPVGNVNSSAIHGDTLLATSYNSNGVFFSADKGNSWVQRGNPPTGTLYFSDGVYTLNNFGIIYTSKDEGFTWKKVYSYNYPPKCALFSNGAVILGTPLGCLRSVDEGEHYLFSNADLAAPSFVYSGLEPLGNLTKTTSSQMLSFDKGDHWFGPFLENGILDLEQKGDTLYGLSIVNKTLSRSWQGLGQWDTLHLSTIPGNPEQLAVTSDALYLLTLNASVREVYRSVDNGETWALQGETQLLIIDFIARDSVLFNLTSDGNVYVSKDKGHSWDLKMNGIDYPINDVFVSGNYVYAYRYNTFQGVFYVSTDYGENWALIPATIERSVAYAAVDHRVFISDIKGDVYVIDGPSGDWTVLTDNLPPGIGQSALTVHQGQTLMLLDLNQNLLYRRELSTLQGKVVKGLVYNDLNHNNVQDAQEPGLPYQTIRAVKGKAFGSSGLNGAFQLTTNVTPDTLRIYPLSPYAQATPAYRIVAPAVDSTYRFAVTLPPGFSDLQADVSLQGVLRPGFKALYRLSVRNIGTDTLSAAPALWLGPDLSLVEATPPIDHISNDTLYWPVRSFAPQSITGFNARIKVSPALTIGSTVHSWGLALPNHPDLTPGDNVFERIDTVYSSFDPNVKEASPSRLLPDDVASERPLYYTIHFQNTGTLPAIIVKVLDTLSARLNPATFQLVAASHPVQAALHDNILEFTFDNINLPDSTRDEAASHGFVKFVITPKPGLLLGDSIVNQASIYFDYNKPVHTNRNVVRVTQLSTTGTPANAPEGRLTAYPNPFKDMLNLELSGGDEGPWQLLLLDASGRVLHRSIVHGAKAIIKPGELTPGHYFAFAYTLEGKLLGSCEVIR